MAREVPVAGVGRFRGFRNGRKIRVPLPLWQGAEDQDGPGSACRRGQPVQGLPQRQENVGFAAVVARGGGPEDRKERETGAAAKGGRAEQYGTTVLHRSFLPKGLRRPHPRDLPHGDKGRQDIHHKHYCCHGKGHCQRRQESRGQHRPRSQGLCRRISTEKHHACSGRIPFQNQIHIEHHDYPDTHRYGGRPCSPGHCAEPQSRRSGAHRLTDTVLVLALPRAQQPEARYISPILRKETSALACSLFSRGHAAAVLRLPNEACDESTLFSSGRMASISVPLARRTTQ